MESLDMVYSNVEWLDVFPNVIITHLLKTHLDHNPILINLNKKTYINQDRPFRLETFWCSYPNFANLVTNSWENRNLLSGTNIFKNNILEWNKKTFGNILSIRKKL